ncbi:MAG: DedA family protein, partial [Carbonactinosporaceae bacterium]
AVAVVVGRWTAALRALVPGAAGMSGMAYRRFAVANVCGGALWAVAVAALGFFAGAGYQRLERRLSLSGELLFGVLIVIGAVAWYAQRRRRARRQEARR